MRFTSKTMSAKIGSMVGVEVPIPDAKTIERFWSKINGQGSPDACWLWESTLFSSGYGTFRMLNRSFRAHRVAYSIINGAIPSGSFVVAHRCDNPKCVNPNHLFLTNQKGNANDRDAKERRVDIPRGAVNGNSKLSTEKVIEMRRRYSDGVISLKSIGLDYGITASNVCAIINRKTWAHI